MATAETNYTPGARHGWIDELCTRLERVAWGQEAERLLTHPEALPDSGALFPLPAWLWVHPGIDVGRKANTAGGSLLLPVRIVRPDGAVRVVPIGCCERDEWSADGMGISESGHTDMVAAPLAEPHPGPLDPRRTEITEPCLSRTELEKRLHRISRDGLDARWQVLLGLEPYVKAAVNDAHGYVCAELAGPDRHSRPVLDHTGLELVSNTLLLGSDDTGRTARRGRSAVSRLLDRCLNANTFQRVDPLRYIKVTLRRDAEDAVRVSIGDPRIGSKVRAISRELGTSNIQEVIAVYRRRYPRDELGERRAAAALDTLTVTAPSPLSNQDLTARFDSTRQV